MELISNILSLENILTEIVFALIGAILFRIWLWWNQKSLTWRREISFWVLFPLSMSFVIGLMNYVTRHSSETKFEGEIKLTGTVDVVPPATKRPSVGIILYPIVRNVGNAPSILYDYKLYLKPSDADSRQAKLLITHAYKTVTVGGPTGELLTFSGTESLYKKTEKPIEKGSLEKGILLFILEEAKTGDVIRAGTLFKLTFKDVKGTEYELVERWTGQIKSLRDFPEIITPLETSPKTEQEQN